MPSPTEHQAELGQIFVPRIFGRPIIHFIEQENRAWQVMEGKLNLGRYLQFQRRLDGNRSWCRARRRYPVTFMATIELINLTGWNNSWVQTAVSNLCRQLQLRRKVRFLFQDTWTIIDEENGVVISGSENSDTTWDGDAWRWPNGGLVRICLSSSIIFPLVWDINRTLPGEYLRRVTWFNTPKDMFLYLTAHELRHLWQFEHPKKLQQIRKLLGIDDEADADIYALRVLSRYRQNPQDLGLP